eukprot:5633655-Lingulodinium_polyedra.AAC.1
MRGSSGPQRPRPSRRGTSQAGAAGEMDSQKQPSRAKGDWASGFVSLNGSSWGTAKRLIPFIDA